VKRGEAITQRRLASKAAGEIVVGQFGVSEIDCLTEPSAVALDAGVNCRTTTRGRSADTSLNWINFVAAFRIVYLFHLS
jgi:hypothetical protein